MKQKSLIKNAIYNFLYTGLNMFLPLITAPYVSRILGASNLGKVNFATSFVSWFVLFAVFGTSSYGVREVAKNRGNKRELNKIFTEILLINGIASIFITIIYFFVVFNTEKFQDDIILYLIMSISIILNIFSLDWLYQGIEEYRYITIRSGIFKIISLITIFLFIKRIDDYIIYGLISVLSTSLSGILNYVYSKKFVKIIFKNINPMRHIKQLFVFLLLSLVISIYTTLDQTLLGFMVDSKSVAFMNRGRMITIAAISVSTSISNVTLPRASYYFSHSKEKYYELLVSIPQYILWITIPAAVGIIILSDKLMFILGGDEFVEGAILLRIISLVVIFSPLSGFLQNQVLVPTSNEKFGLICAVVTALVSLVLNIIMIPKLGYIGAALVAVISEFCAVSFRLFIIKRNVDIKKIQFFNKSTFQFVTAALVMGLNLLLINQLFNNLILETIISLLVGTISYFTVLLVIKEKLTMTTYSKIKIKLVKLKFK